MSAPKRYMEGKGLALEPKKKDQTRNTVVPGCKVAENRDHVGEGKWPFIPH
jgi:hypothetical protein